MKTSDSIALGNESVQAKTTGAVPRPVAPWVVGDPVDRSVRVVAFSAGGADSPFEFGMVHALLVTDARPPHLAAGISSGAIVAAALADVLQAGQGSGSPEHRRLAQVGRFRELLAEIQRAPTDFAEGAFPDLTEVSARAGLRPLELPTQGGKERQERERIALTRFGLIQALNSLFALRVRLSELTRMARLVLELRSVGEWRCAGWPKWVMTGLRGIRSTVTALKLWWLTLLPIVRDAPIALEAVRALCRSNSAPSPPRPRTGPGWKARAQTMLGPIRAGAAGLKARTGLSAFGHWLGRTTVVRGLRSGGTTVMRGFRGCGAAVAWVKAWLDYAERCLAQAMAPRLRPAISILFEPVLARALRRIGYGLSFPVMFTVWCLTPAVVAGLAVGGRCQQRLRGRTRAWATAGLTVACVVAAALCASWSIATVQYPGSVSGFSPAAAPGNWGQALWAALRTWGDAGAAALLIFLEHWVEWGTACFLAAMLIEVSPWSTPLHVRALRGFDLDRDLLPTAMLRRLLMRAFHVSYEDKPEFTQAIDGALGGRKRPTKGSEPPRTLAAWIAAPTLHGGTAGLADGILVTPVAADLATGRLVCLPPPTALVDALTAACAITPWFAPQPLNLSGGRPEDGQWFIDGANVAREPLGAVLRLLRQLHVHGLRSTSAAAGSPLPPRTGDEGFSDFQLPAEPSSVEICVVSPLPTARLLARERSQARQAMGVPTAHVPPPVTLTAPHPPGTLHRIVDLLALQAAHAAKDERSLVVYRNQALALADLRSGALYFTGNPRAPGDRLDPDHWHVFARLREIEPARPLKLLWRLLSGGGEAARHELVREAVADGCRASLRQLFAQRIKALPKDLRGLAACRALLKALSPRQFPGRTAAEDWPGVPEVCARCRFHREPQTRWFDDEHPRPRGPVEPWDATGKDWPVSGCADLGTARAGTVEQTATRPSLRPIPDWAEHWPLPRPDAPDSRRRPTISLVFSGGVFRGVFQVGVLNALQMTGVRPDIVAGASVGTILAALSAKALTETDPAQGQHRVRAVAATFLAVDRLVLTDRFADFIRRFTLRAGDARFSPRDIDALFRTYDQRGWERQARQSRRVLAGLQRLFYLTPPELLILLGIHDQDGRSATRDRVVRYAQRFLDRAGIGQELLGAEPLELLIRQHVLGEDRATQDASFRDLANGVQFLATATNLTTGELDLLGSHGSLDQVPATVPGLLASSAFPGVFRPRADWELRAAASGLPQELVDGGIADNLPILAVMRFLFLSGRLGVAATRPCVNGRPAPHLLFTASLEVERRPLAGPEATQVAGHWIATQAHAKRLQYNIKVDGHRTGQRITRAIFNSLTDEQKQRFEFLDQHVVCVKPKWLCGTFGFHPMLGFQRERQARSIAHGCALTLVNLAREKERADQEGWHANWWSPITLDPQALRIEGEGPDAPVALRPRPCRSTGECCFANRIGDQPAKCPFSPGELKSSGLPRATQRALAEIYRACGKSTTHQDPDSPTAT